MFLVMSSCCIPLFLYSVLCQRFFFSNAKITIFTALLKACCEYLIKHFSKCETNLINLMTTQNYTLSINHYILFFYYHIKCRDGQPFYCHWRIWIIWLSSWTNLSFTHMCMCRYAHSVNIYSSRIYAFWICKNYETNALKNRLFPVPMRLPIFCSQSMLLLEKLYGLSPSINSYTSYCLN